MKKLLLTAALCAFAAPAYASFVALTSEDGDETSMFLYDGGPTETSYGSTSGNGSHKTQDVKITTDVNANFSNGNATIKPDSGSLTTLFPTPQTVKGIDTSYDGFFTRGQLERVCDGKCPKLPKGTVVSGVVHMQVNGGPEFDFTETASNSGDFASIGFDEPGDKTTESLITSVKVWVTSSSDLYNVDFKEVKQIDWSFCDTGGSCLSTTTTGAVPEPSTWAMGLIGFGLTAGFAAFNRRKSRFLLRRK